MCSHFSANQYEDAFNPTKLRNWTVPRKHKARPSTLDGYTQIIANNAGHLKVGIPRSAESPWGTFMGTWDMPRKIPPARPSYTARSNRAANTLKLFKENSTLNNAINGYKEFPITPKKKASPTGLRPSAPTPPLSPKKSSRTPTPKSSSRKSASPVLSKSASRRSSRASSKAASVVLDA